MASSSTSRRKHLLSSVGCYKEDDVDTKKTRIMACYDKKKEYRTSSERRIEMREDNLIAI